MEKVLCTRCHLYKTSPNPKIDSVIPEDVKIDLAFVSQNPGEIEQQTGIPLTGPAGENFNFALQHSNIDRSKVFVGNIVRCLTPNNRAPTPAECKACIPYLLAELRNIKPRVIVTLGLTATKSLLRNDDLRMTEIHGKAINGKAILGFNCTIVPTWHPSPVTFLHNADRKSQMIMDIRFANGLITGNNLTSNKEKDWNSLFVTDYKTWKMFLPVLQQSDHWTIDIETTGLDGRASDAAITNIGIAPTSNFGLSVILPELSPQDKKLFLNDFKLAMEDPSIKKSGHGFKFDMKYMKEIFGFWVQGFYHDTAIGHSIIKPGDSNKLKSISWIYTPKMGGYENDLSQFGGLMKATPLQRGEYNIDDTICCRRICEIQEKKLDINKRTFLMYDISMPAYEVLGEMEYKGVAVDEYTIDRLAGEYERLLMLLKQDIYLNPNVMQYNIYHGIKFNPNSSQQLGEILFGDRYFKLKSIKQTPTGDQACDKEVLKYFSNRGSEFCKQILDFHGLSKLYSTYLIGIKKHIVNRRVHTNYYMDVAISGRTCVSKGTYIDTVRDLSKNPNGTKIEDVKIGDLVYCYDEKLNLRIRKVKWAGKTGRKQVIRLHWVGTGRHTTGYLDVTPDHKIRRVDGTYINAINSNHSNVLALSRDVCKLKNGIRKRSRLYVTGSDKEAVLEHRFIYEELSNEKISNESIHHVDKNPLNHTLQNLQKLSKGDHARLHSVDTIQSPRARENSIIAIKKSWKLGHHKVRYGVECYNYLNLSKYQCLRLLAQSKGRLNKISIDYETITNYCNKYDINISWIKYRYDKNGNYISRKRLVDLIPFGIKKIQVILGISYYRLKLLYAERSINIERQWGGQFQKLVSNNHIIVKIEYLDRYVDVYDLEVEDFHNFIANGICVANSSSAPNLQNLFRGSNIRSIFVADKGFIFLDTDYKQMELVVSTFYTQDPIMIEAIKSGDAHTYIAKLIFGFSDPDEVKKRRDFIKTLNFGVLYGMGPYKLSQQLNITMDEAKALIEEYFKIMSPTKKWLNDRRKQAEEEGYVVSKFGRIRYYKMKGSQNDGYSNSLDSSYNSAVNHPIQSVASDLMLIGLRKWRDYLVSKHLYQDRAYIALQVHDSITSCVEEKLIVELAVKKKEILESIHFPFMPVPLTVDVKIGYDWGTLKLLDI